MTRLTLAALAVLALAELAPAPAQFVIGSGPTFGYSGRSAYSYQSGFGFSVGGPRFRVAGFSGFSGGFVTRSYVSPFGFGAFGPVGPVGLAPFGALPFGATAFGGWGPGFGFGPSVVAVPVPVPVVGAGGPTPADPGAAGNGPLPPQAVRPADFVVIAPKREATVPEVTRVAAPPRPGKPPAGAGDPFKPVAGVKGETPEADPKKEAARLVTLARAAFAGGAYGRAAEFFERAIAADPAEAAAYFWSAQAKFAAGQYAEAVARIREGLARDPKWPASGFEPEALYGDRPERFVVHLLALRKAVADNPNQATLEFLLGYELWFSGEKVEADKLFRAAEKRLAAPGPLALFK